MDSDLLKNDEKCNAKRGPYKKYVLHGNVSEIPASTKRDWKGKRKESREKQSTLMTANSIKYGEDTSSEEPITDTQDIIASNSGIGSNLQMITENSSESSMHVHEDDAVVDKRDAVQSPSEWIDSLTGNAVLNLESQDGRSYSYRPEDKERIQPEENYTDDFLIKSLLTLATKLRFNFTYEAAESVLKLLGAMDVTSAPQPSKYFLKKIINEFSKSMIVHHICDSCGRYAGVEVAEMICPHCNKTIDVNSSLRSGNSFLYISLEYQLREIFEMTTAHETYEMPREKKIESAIEDIYDGELYKKNLVPGLLSVNCSVDGAPVFESSNFSIYPILCTINELEPRERNEHVLLCGLWFGSGKPQMNEYLKPFVEETKTLYNTGFTYVYNGTSYTKKCRVLVAVCDWVARPMLSNTTQFNGKYGCGLCLHPGESIAKGRGTTRVYQLLGSEKNAFGEGLRTHEQTLEHAVRREKGVKGRSILCEIPEFDIIACLDVDWMHAVNLGVCRQFAKLWFDSVYHQEMYYIGHLINDVDELILSYTPSLEVSRTPRKMSDRVHWKAHEWVIWLLFYSLPTLSAFLPQKYVDHWALLVDAIQILCKTSIMRSEIVLSQRWLIEFIHGVDQLYGREHVSFNVHLLAHLCESVTKFGPLWTHSAFVYENANQVLLNYVKSSKGVAEQICEMSRAKYVVDRLRSICLKKMTKGQREYLDHVLNTRARPEPMLILNHASMLGVASIHAALPRVHSLAFDRANLQINQNSPIASYKRAIISGEIVHSKSYTRVEKRANYYVRLINNEIFEIELFYVINEDNNHSCYALGSYFERHNKSLIAKRRLDHLIVLKNRLDNLAVINVTMIKEKVFVLPVEHMQLWLACVHPNRYELLT